MARHLIHFVASASAAALGELGITRFTRKPSHFLPLPLIPRRAANWESDFAVPWVIVGHFGTFLSQQPAATSRSVRTLIYTS